MSEQSKMKLNEDSNPWLKKTNLTSDIAKLANNSGTETPNKKRKNKK